MAPRPTSVLPDTPRVSGLIPSGSTGPGSPTAYRAGLPTFVSRAEATRQRLAHARERRVQALGRYLAGVGAFATWARWERVAAREREVLEDYVAEARELSDVDLYGRMLVPIDDGEGRRPPRAAPVLKRRRVARGSRFPMVDAGELLEARR